MAPKNSRFLKKSRNKNSCFFMSRKRAFFPTVHQRLVARRKGNFHVLPIDWVEMSLAIAHAYSSTLGVGACRLWRDLASTVCSFALSFYLENYWLSPGSGGVVLAVQRRTYVVAWFIDKRWLSWSPVSVTAKGLSRKSTLTRKQQDDRTVGHHRRSLR